MKKINPCLTLESSGDISEVGNTTTNNQDLALRVLMLAHKSEDGTGIVECLLLIGSAGVLACEQHLILM